LWDAPRLIITPHVGGQAAWRIDAMTDFFCDNLRRYLRGEEVRNRVDKQLGFPPPQDWPTPVGPRNAVALQGHHRQEAAS
jgi:D-3-phosphoglycerate dehydrogenase